MKEAFERIREKLEGLKSDLTDWAEDMAFKLGIEKAQNIVSEVEAEFGKDINVRGNGWIPCEKALPKEEGWYFVYTKPNKGHKSINKAEFRKGSDTPCWRGAGGHWGNVIAWMPLPEPYKPEKGE